MMTSILINATNLAKEMAVSKPYVSKLVSEKRLDFVKTVDSNGKVLYDLNQVLKVFSKKNDISKKSSSSSYSDNCNNNISTNGFRGGKSRSWSSHGSNLHVRKPLNNTEKITIPI